MSIWNPLKILGVFHAGKNCLFEPSARPVPAACEKLIGPIRYRAGRNHTPRRPPGPASRPRLTAEAGAGGPRRAGIAAIECALLSWHSQKDAEAFLLRVH